MKPSDYYKGKLRDETKKLNYIFLRKHTQKELEIQRELVFKLESKLSEIDPKKHKGKVKKCEWCDKKFITTNKNRFICFKCKPEKIYEARFVGEARFTAMDSEEADAVAYDFLKNVDFELIDISEEGIAKQDNF